jgi:prepilin-type N-terminal cleavage/methylation domain-containing protein
MHRKAFTLIEILIIIAIVSILMAVTINWYLNYQKKLTIEGETHKIYQTLKEIQLKAKTTKEEYCVNLTTDGKKLNIDALCDSNTDSEIALEVPFKLKNAAVRLKVNKFGIWLPPTNSIYAQNGTIADINCVKVDDIRVCEGSWNGKDCECKY